MTLYGLFYGESDRTTAKWAMFTNKRIAMRHAKRVHGYIGSVDSHVFDGGRQYGIDAPTFKAYMAPVADYR